MNEINRFLTRRGKDKPEKNASSAHLRSKSTDGMKITRPKSADSILCLFRHRYDTPNERKLDKDEAKKVEKEEAKKVQRILQKLRDTGKYESFDEAQVEFGLRTEYAAGDEERAYDILVLFRESMDGIVMPYDPRIKMLGAKNVDGVTCYLDSLLFSMFGHIQNFLPMLYTTFQDEPRKRLSGMIRVWVNMLRTGKLIHSDITKHLQEALLACGWKEACSKVQQDASEAFQFITEQLQLPLLTLKTDLFHVGAEDKTGDHKLVNERLLNVAVLPDREDGHPIQLEDCLEEFFNNVVEVRRPLERSNTLSSITPKSSPQLEKRDHRSQLRTSDVSGSGPSTPDARECNSPALSIRPPTVIDTSEEHDRPLSPSFRVRNGSIIKSFDETISEVETASESGEISTEAVLRKGSRLRKEVQIPAWAMSSLIPFFTENKSSQPPTTDAQVASHFSSTRPVLGICLKRYAVLENGETVRRDAQVDIPTQIAIPHFIQQEDESMFQHLKICLVAMIAHRNTGTSTNEGHYVSYIRGERKPVTSDSALKRTFSNSTSPPEYYEDPWFKHDDLLIEKVTEVDIHQALREEMSYLLFYRIQPLFDEAVSEISEEKPPSYTDSGIEMAVQQASPREEASQNPGYFDGAAQLTPTPNRVSFSDDMDPSRRSLNLPDAYHTYSRRGSVAVTEGSRGSRASSFIASTITTPGEENPAVSRVSRQCDEENSTSSRLSRAASKFRAQHNRSSSVVADTRMSFSFRKKSKDQLKPPSDKSTSVNHLVIDGAVEEPIDEALPDDVGEPTRKKGKGKDKGKTSAEKKHRGSNSFPRAMFKDGGRDGERECAIM